MKTIIKRLIMSVLFVLSSFIARSQTVHDFTFEYDASGNRIYRIHFSSAHATVPPLSTETSKEVQPLTEKKTEELSYEINPNPTTGIVRLNVKGVGNEQVYLFIFSIQGRLLVEYKVNNGANNIDFSKYPSGLYLMKIIFKDKTSEVKIVKQ